MTVANAVTESRGGLTLSPGVPEGRRNVAHRACPERSEGEAVWKWLEDDQKTTTGVTHGIHIHGMNPLPGIVECSIALFNCERRYGSGF